MRRIAIVDTYYPEFLKSISLNSSEYEPALQELLGYFFGTGDAYSQGLRELGWEAIDIIANATELQWRWSHENGNGLLIHNLEDIALMQIYAFNPDVIFLQNLDYFSLDNLQRLKRRGYILAGQCSCALPGESKLREMDVIFTSFPHYLSKFASLGVWGVYLPLAFDERMKPEESKRHIPMIFIGGLGHQWTNAQFVLEEVSRQIPESHFYGYGYEKGRFSNWYGQAWGREMYRLLGNSKIALNRHGAVAGGYANNLRLFEATGCGAMLLTEWAPNLIDLFAEDECVSYSSPQDAVDKIRYYLAHDEERAAIAVKGQAKTLRMHTYKQRLPQVSAILNAKLAGDLMHIQA